MIDLLVARRQHGLVTLDQVRAAGCSRSAWHRAHRTGVLVPMHPGVSRLAVVAPSPEQAVLAATLLTGGAASHLSAAWLSPQELAAQMAREENEMLEESNRHLREVHRQSAALGALLQAL